MKVMVKRDSSASVLIDCGDGEEGKAKLQKLVDTNGASAVTMEDGSPLPADVLPQEAEQPKAKPKAKAKSKKRGR